MASTGEVWTLGHRPALDGVRGIAILLVVIAHVRTELLPLGGAFGVILFFVLSGFLITRLLLGEHDRTGSLDLAAFFGRRARRLLPALAVVLVATPVLMWVVDDARLGQFPRNAVAIALYVGNVIAAFGGNLGPLSHTWSLAIEEQFYLLWPLALLGLLRGRGSLHTRLWLLTGVALAWRLLAAGIFDYNRVNYLLDTNAFALLMGCALAAHQRAGLRVPAWVQWPALVGLCLLSAWHGGLAGVLVGGAGAAVLAVILVAGASADTGAGMLARPVMVWLGSVSYGWYLWHQLLISLEFNGSRVGALGHVLFGLVGLGVAWLSLRYVERPFLRQAARARTTGPAVETELTGAAVDGNAPAATPVSR